MPANSGGGGDPTGGSGKMVLDIMRAGGLIVAGTDTPNAINLHGELMSYTMAGMTNFEALQGGDGEPGAARSASTPARSKPASSPTSSWSTATRSPTSRTRTRCGA